MCLVYIYKPTRAPSQGRKTRPQKMGTWSFSIFVFSTSMPFYLNLKKEEQALHTYNIQGPPFTLCALSLQVASYWRIKSIKSRFFFNMSHTKMVHLHLALWPFACPCFLRAWTLYIKLACKAMYLDSRHLCW